MSARKTVFSALTVLSIFAVIVLSVTTLDYLACSLYCTRAAVFFRDNEAPRSDVAVVFFGDHTRIFGLGKETIKRLTHAAVLYKSGRTTNIVCTGGSGLLRLRGEYGSELMKAYLEDAGISADAVFADSGSFDSVSNWEKALAIIESHRWKRITLVSSQLHLYRLAKIIRADSLELSYSPYPTDCIDSLRDYTVMQRWIHHEWIAMAAQSVMPERFYRTAIRLVR